MSRDQTREALVERHAASEKRRETELAKVQSDLEETRALLESLKASVPQMQSAFAALPAPERFVSHGGAVGFAERFFQESYGGLAEGVSKFGRAVAQLCTSRLARVEGVMRATQARHAAERSEEQRALASIDSELKAESERVVDALKRAGVKVVSK